MQIVTITWRLAWCVMSTILYKLATLPLAIAGLFLVPMVIRKAEWHTSPLTGQRILGVPKGWLFLWSNAQDGIDPEWYREHRKNWPRWWRMYEWAAIRNRIRNFPFLVPWLHKTSCLTYFDNWTIAGVRVELWWSGWFTELKASRGRWFLDIGVRLDQPESWGARSWAFRPFGRVHG